LKVQRPEGNQLGYLDFGLLSTVPPQVRDGLICAVSYLVFAKDVDAVASLFGELQLLPPDVMEDPDERAALTAAMEITLNQALVYEQSPNDSSTQIPTLKFDKLLDSLTRLVPRFRFQLPPYFINNARAMSTLEGIARSLDPSFNVFQVMYPFALNKLLTNPTNSPVVDRTLQDLIRDKNSQRVDLGKVAQLLKDSALITGYSSKRVLYDIMKTRGGRRLGLTIAKEEARLRNPLSRKKAGAFMKRSAARFLRL
jgi:aarF domain-containing kinase